MHNASPDDARSGTRCARSENVALEFVDANQPGISRRQSRGKWQYFAADGTRITDRAEIDRLNAVALPPAYSDAWFATSPKAHLLATGKDARGRKQYRYHPQFRAHRDSLKFETCAAFGEALPRLRKIVDADLKRRGFAIERVLASIVRLLDTGSIRIGNETYAATNRSFGAATLRGRHVRVSGDSVRLRFRGKGGKQHDLLLNDRNLARFVRRLQELPGQHLFQYVGADGVPVPVNSADVNAYIRKAMGGNFSAKDFRTWTASVLAFAIIHDADADQSLKAVLARVSERLGNTPAIARKSYVHPALIASIANPAPLRAIKLPRAAMKLSRHERGLLEFLRNAGM